MDPRNLPREMKEILIYDRRPAFLFIAPDGTFPLIWTHDGQKVCPYCANPLKEKPECTCFGYRKVKEYNKQLQKI